MLETVTGAKMFKELRRMAPGALDEGWREEVVGSLWVDDLRLKAGVHNHEKEGRSESCNEEQ